MEQQLKLKHLLVPQESVVALDKTIYEPDHVRIQKVMSEGVQLWRCFFFFFSWWWEGESKYHYKRAMIGLPAKRHLNYISLAGR